MDGEEGARHLAGMVFVACMFIGAGIGLIFDRPDVGGAIGMGVGFLLMGLIKAGRVKVQPVAIGLPRTLPPALMIVLGGFMVAAGVLMVYKPEWLYPYVASLAAISLGVLVLAAGLASLTRRLSEQGGVI